MLLWTKISVAGSDNEDEMLTANDHKGCERGGRHRGGLAGFGSCGS
jgi:hypothetical protein